MSKVIDISYADFLAVTLTSLSIMLTGLAIIIAIAAFKTISDIKSDAKKMAKERVRIEINNIIGIEVKKVLDEYAKNGTLRDMIDEVAMSGRMEAIGEDYDEN